MKHLLTDLSIKTIGKDVKTPFRSTTESAGYDIFSNKKIVLPAGKIICIRLPFTFEGILESKYEVRVYPRSSFGIKKQFHLAYKNNKNVEYLILDLKDDNFIINALNDGTKDLIINKGEHFAQFLICEKEFKKEHMDIESVPKKERQKYDILQGKIVEETPNLYSFVLEEDLVLKSKEQKTFATGLRTLIAEGYWAAITSHKDVKDKIMLANQTAVIDRDYAFTDNFGHCFIALVNLWDKEIKLEKGTNLLSWWSEKYYILNNEITPIKQRIGGIGSTSRK